MVTASDGSTPDRYYIFRAASMIVLTQPTSAEEINNLARESHAMMQAAPVHHVNEDKHHHDETSALIKVS